MKKENGVKGININNKFKLGIASILALGLLVGCTNDKELKTGDAVKDTSDINEVVIEDDTVVKKQFVEDKDLESIQVGESFDLVIDKLDQVGVLYQADTNLEDIVQIKKKEDGKTIKGYINFDSGFMVSLVFEALFGDLDDAENYLDDKSKEMTEQYGDDFIYEERESEEMTYIWQNGDEKVLLELGKMPDGRYLVVTARIK